MRTRGFTLLELLIALSLVLAMAALSLPVMMRTTEARRFEAASDQIMHQMRMARSHAQLEGAPVELVYITGEGIIEARFFDPEAEADDDRRREDDTSAPIADDRVISERWAQRVLDAKLTLSDTPPEPAIEQLEALTSWADIESSMDLENTMTSRGNQSPRQRIRLAVFMPDGSALMGRAMWLSDEHGRVGRFTVDAFTGLSRFERLEDMDEAGVAASDDEEEDAEAENDVSDDPEGSDG